MPSEDERLSFRPVARMVNILGQHLIRDNTVGLMELIKNGYDADATTVTVELKNLSDPTKTEVVIEDDGTGMDEATIKGPWSEPAHGGKQAEKERLERSKKGRLPLGEKGVGRFAAQKLGRYLELVTRPQNGGSEYHVRIDWNAFDKADSYLDQIGFPLEKRTPEVFTGRKHGTRLIIRDARIPWKKYDVEKLQASLIRLLSPTNATSNFSVVFKCRDYPELESLDRGEVLEKFQFKIDCSIDEKGKATYTYSHRSTDGKIEESRVEGTNLWAQSNKEWEKYDPSCGPIRIIISAWLREVDNLSNYGLTRAQLSILSGVSIYRDGFRIIPYGDPSDDWLGLDLRRTNQPSQRYGNNQLIGQVEISQEKNAKLVDKTSREGLQENQAYSDVRDLTLGCLSLLETESLEQRSKMKKTTDTTKTLKTKIQELQSQLEEIKKAPQKIAELPQEHPSVASNPEVAPGHETTGLPASVVEVPVEILRTLEQQVEDVDTSAVEALKELSELKEEKQEAYLHLIGIGLAAERFTHEFDRMVGNLNANLKALEEKQPFSTYVKAMRRIVDALRSEVALLGVARYVRRAEEHPRSFVAEVIALTMAAHSDEIADNEIQVEYTKADDFTAAISAASLSQVLDNIISNAIYWLGVKSEIKDRKLSIVVDSTKKSITISNNGSLISHNIKQALFKAPFVTSKPDGRGLGLYICHEIMKRNNGTVEFLAENDQRNKYGSAAFMIKFNQPREASI